VVLNHANWHVLSDFDAGEAGGYPFVVLDQVGKFAIPAFMLIAGYFTAYATSGGKQDLRWSIVRTRLENLLWPWLLWSFILLLGQSFQGHAISPVEFLRNLFIQYYFIPLLIFYYLLAPFIVQRARKNARALLIGAALVQLLSTALFYARVYAPGFPDALNSWVDLGPLQYLRFAFYFPLGLVIGMFPRQVKPFLARVKPALPWLTLFLFGLSFLETARAYSAGGEVWPIGGDQTKLTSALFSTALLFCFAAYERLQVPYRRTINDLGTRSYGIYLCHYVILGLLAKLIERLIPWLSHQGWLLQPLLFGLTVTLSVLLMRSIARLSLAKRFYRYIFG
jgi:surface polysaccharide O-acyltransferase-like enzyme